jgi:glycerol-3-phosphate dehydrogenase
MDSTQVVIIGGGATGAGILWDLSLRGIAAILLEQKDIANGATGRCHGLLHSGGRYAVKDPKAAAECIAENRIVKTIAPHCVEDSGGLFVQCRGDDPSFFEQWQRAAESIDIPSENLSSDEAHALEPNLAADILGAFTTPDAHVDVFRLVLANLEAAIAHGGLVRTYSDVRTIHVENGRVQGVQYRDTQTGEYHEIRCELVINAAGGWTQHVAAMAGADVPVRCDKGTLLVLNHRLSGHVLNRCRIPGDGDILVPAGPVCILGTSSMTVPGPDGLTTSKEEIERLLCLGGQMVPELEHVRVTRVFSGVRPLYVPRSDSGSAGREISRGFALLDHAVRDNIEGFVSIVGGKLTTYRLMAAQVADCVAKKLNVGAECTTDRVPLRATMQSKLHRDAHLLPTPALEKLEIRMGSAAAQIVSAIEVHPELAEMVCECELVTRAELNFILRNSAPVPVKTIADVGRRTRLGFGPCQGTFCGYKVMLAGFQSQRWTAHQAANELCSYMKGRWKGQSPIPHGQQVEQVEMGRDIYDFDIPLAAIGENCHGD